MEKLSYVVKSVYDSEGWRLVAIEPRDEDRVAVCLKRGTIRVEALFVVGELNAFGDASDKEAVLAFSSFVAKEVDLAIEAAMELAAVQPVQPTDDELFQAAVEEEIRGAESAIEEAVDEALEVMAELQEEYDAEREATAPAFPEEAPTAPETPVVKKKRGKKA